MPEKVLLIGTNVRNVASSAKRAGYEVDAITKYADADLFIYCNRVYSLDAIGRAEEIAQQSKAKVVLCSNFETFEIKAEMLCNEPKVARKIVDKLEFYKTLENTGIPHPAVLRKPEGRVIAKPRFGGGGEGVRLTDRQEDGCILQEFIEGIPCSVSLLASKEMVPIACNFIFSGWREMNASGFRYSGNLTPLKIDEEKRRELERVAVETAELFDLRGSIGVDFILADRPYVLELNPRFQGSLDSIEWSLDINLFSLHVKAFEGKKIEVVKPKRFAIRAIYFADRDWNIRRDLTGNPFFADIPTGPYRKGDPMVSILSSGNYDEVFRKVRERKELFLKLISE
ncbi:MAG: ATP-grasp domain-containing protein [Archaeoglobales archaeon]|nr:ATP-grasp domain-containing protein [Archaeoglobales archaeon]